MYTALRLCVARVQRRATALITSITIASVWRAFSQLEWDENLHPRGANGKFIGTGGMKAEREAYHLEHALKAFERKTAGVSEAQRKAAGDQMQWRGHTGMKAILAHLGNLRTTADAEAHGLAHDPDTLHELRLLRDEYQLRLVQANRSDTSRARMQREIRVIDRYLARANIGLPEPGHVPASVANHIRSQIDAGLAQEEARAPRTPQEESHIAPNLVTSHREPTPSDHITPETTDALGIHPPTEAELALMRERGGTQGVAAREWPMFALRLQREPQSKIGDGAYLAPYPHVTKRGDAADAERARRASNALYRALMEQGEITFTGKSGQSLTLRRRWNLLRQTAAYDLFVGDNARPARGYANLVHGSSRGQWSGEDVLRFLQEQSA